MSALRPLRLVAVLGALALLVTACGDDDEAADDPTVQDDDGAPADGGTDDASEPAGDDGDGACSLVSTEELEEIFGSPFGPGVDTLDEVTSGDQCAWTNTDAPPLRVVSVVHYDDDALQEVFGQSAEDFLQLNRDQLPVDEELDTGDEAFRSGTLVWARDGDDVYNVLVTGETDANMDGLKALAERVVEG